MKNKFYEDTGNEKVNRKKLFRNRLIHSRPWQIVFITIPLFILFFLVSKYCTEEQSRNFLYGFFTLSLMFLVRNFKKSDKANILITKQKEELDKQKKLIEQQKLLVDKSYQELHEKNKELLDSIRYAKRIQTALITSEKYIENSLNRLINTN